jgi:hypothetical protein
VHLAPNQTEAPPYWHRDRRASFETPLHVTPGVIVPQQPPSDWRPQTAHSLRRSSLSLTEVDSPRREH